MARLDALISARDALSAGGPVGSSTMSMSEPSLGMMPAHMAAADEQARRFEVFSASIHQSLAQLSQSLDIFASRLEGLETRVLSTEALLDPVPIQTVQLAAPAAATVPASAASRNTPEEISQLVFGDFDDDKWIDFLVQQSEAEQLLSTSTSSAGLGAPAAAADATAPPWGSRSRSSSPLTAPQVAFKKQRKGKAPAKL